MGSCRPYGAFIPVPPKGSATASGLLEGILDRDFNDLWDRHSIPQIIKIMVCFSKYHKL